MRRFAAIDIGSQTIRLLIADITANSGFVPVFKDRAIIRLGEGLAENGFLHREAIQRAVDCIADFTLKSTQMKAQVTYASATASVRTAANRNYFLQEVYTATGILPRVLTGEEEARTSLAGVKSVLHNLPPSIVVLDIGGGSTEFACMHGDCITKTVSIPLGVIGLTERFLMRDPPPDSEVEAMRASIRRMLHEHDIFGADFTAAETLVATAGTATTLAAMDMGMTDYDADKINGYCMTKVSVQELFNRMIALPVQDRSRLRGLEPGRAAVMPAGTAILIEVMNLLDKTMALVSDAGLLEGILLQHV